MSYCYHSSPRLSTPFSGFVLKWCLKTMTTMQGNFYTLSHYCCSLHQNCHTAIQKLPNMEIFEMHKVVEFGF